MINLYVSRIFISLFCVFFVFVGSANSAEDSCSDSLKNTLVKFYPSVQDEWVPDEICYDQFKNVMQAAKPCHEALNLVPQKVFLLTPAAALKEVSAAVVRYSKRKKSNYIACENVMKNNWVTPILEKCTVAGRDSNRIDDFNNSCIKI